jgi:malate dehydrogenase (oxaloacetate-decarboxylating)
LQQLAGLSGVPILLDTTDPDEIVHIVQAIAPSFGAIKLEDIAAPACFDIEERLRESLEMPVFQDDQQGTAAVTLAAVINVCRLVGRDVAAVQIGCIGLGAAGLSVATLLRDYTGRPVLGADIDRAALERHAQRGNTPATLDQVLEWSDVVIATTGVAGLIDPERVRRGQVILALSNPTPEITPQAAMEAGAAFATDGTAVNNLLGFPGLLRGALEARARRFTPSMFVAAGESIAGQAPAGEVMPGPLDRAVHHAVSLAVVRTAVAEGVARAIPDEEALAASFASD